MISRCSSEWRGVGHPLRHAAVVLVAIETAGVRLPRSARVNYVCWPPQMCTGIRIQTGTRALGAAMPPSNGTAREGDGFYLGEHSDPSGILSRRRLSICNLQSAIFDNIQARGHLLHGWYSLGIDSWVHKKTNLFDLKLRSCL
ncbi:unnamed protein product [Scytosiphon promiscuus]